MSCQSREAKHTRVPPCPLRSPSRHAVLGGSPTRIPAHRPADGSAQPKAGMIETRRCLVSLLSARVARRQRGDRLPAARGAQSRRRRRQAQAGAALREGSSSGRPARCGRVSPWRSEHTVAARRTQRAGSAASQAAERGARLRSWRGGSQRERTLHGARAPVPSLPVPSSPRIAPVFSPSTCRESTTTTPHSLAFQRATPARLRPSTPPRPPSTPAGLPAPPFAPVRCTSLAK